MSNLMNEEALLDAVAGCPWASAGEIAHHLGMDKSNTRRDLKKLCRDGKVIGRDDGGTLRFSLPGSSASPPEFPKSIGNSPQVIDGDFKVLSNGSQTPSTSRSLVPAAATFDSRLAGTLARNERARRLRSPQVQTMGQQVIAAWNQGYLDDPNGDLALAAAAQAEAEAAREKLAREQAEAARALAARPREPTTGELLSAFVRQAADVWSGMQDRAREREREEWEARQSGPIGQHVHFVEEDRFAARRRAEQEEAERAETPRNHVAELLAKAKKTAPKKEEPRAKTWGEWFAARFSTPSKPVLR